MFTDQNHGRCPFGIYPFKSLFSFTYDSHFTIIPNCDTLAKRIWFSENTPWLYPPLIPTISSLSARAPLARFWPTGFQPRPSTRFWFWNMAEATVGL